jgi:RimJ/RimL family protein N-acetyltransferase
MVDTPDKPSSPAPAFVLRPPRIADADQYCDFLADRRVSLWLEDECQRPITIEKARAFFVDGGWARWAIEHDSEFVGLTGLDAPDLGRGLARMFIVIGRADLWGRGLGSAVLREVLRVSFHELGLRKVVADILAPNLASLRIHEKIGFVTEGRLRRDAWREGRWVDRVLVSILAEEFERHAG